MDTANPGRNTTRRALLAGGAALAAVGAAGFVWRASRSPRVRALLGIPEPVLDIAALKPAIPPVPLPEAMLVDAAGNPHPLSSFAGSGLVLNFWATWCAPCVAEMPALASLARRVAGDGIRVLAAASDSGGAAAVSRFFDRYGIDTLQVWLDPANAAGLALGTHGVTPTTIIIDRRGRETARLEGAVHWDTAAAVAEVRRLAG
nr:TlpA disulfide reductase family protein [uncultured Rhodopila sp.]